VRVRVFVIVLLVAVPAVGLWAVAYHHGHELAAHEVQLSALRLARLAAMEHSRIVERSRGLLAALAVEVLEDGPQACAPFFAAYRRHAHEYANVGVIGLDGTVLCSGVPLSRPINVRDRGYFQRALETRDFAAGEFQIGRITGRPGLNFGYPVITASGQVTAVVFPWGPTRSSCGR
jgi:hypothetical protein